MERSSANMHKNSAWQTSHSAISNVPVNKPVDNNDPSQEPGDFLALSMNKRHYMENPKLYRNKESQMSVDELREMSAYYAGKLGMPIHVNGDLHKERVVENKAEEMNRVRALQKDIETSPFQDAILLRKYWQSIMTPDLFEALKERLKQDEELKSLDVGLGYPPVLSMKDPNAGKLLSKLQAIVDEAVIITPAHLLLLQKEFQADFKKRFDVASQAGLSKDEAIEEIREFAGKQNPDALAGYLYTSGVSKGKQHVETLLLDGQDVINLIPFNTYGDKKIARSDLTGLYTSDIANLVALEFKDRKSSLQFCPQATEKECASLGLAYLKEYGKNQAEQLRKYTLKLSFESERFLLPSPQVLRYSQSELYTKLVRAMVEGTDETLIVEHKGKKYKVLTLNGILARKGKIDSSGPVDLEEFRSRWLAGFNAAMEKRSAMDFHSLKYNTTENQYLVYKAARNMEKLEHLK